MRFSAKGGSIPDFLLQQFEALGAGRRNAHLTGSDDVAGRIDGLLAGPQHIWNRRVLPGKIGGETDRIGMIFLSGAFYAALNALNLVDDDVAHTA